MMRVEAYLDNLANLDFTFPEIDEVGRRPRMGAPSMLSPPFPTTGPERSKVSTARAEKPTGLRWHCLLGTVSRQARVSAHLEWPALRRHLAAKRLEGFAKTE